MWCKIMAYFDVDYCIKNEDAKLLPSNYDIVDVYFVRKPHYCKSTGDYWENKQDESIYVKVKEDSDISRAILLAKNEVSEYEMYFDNDFQKQKFYEEYRDTKFYNNLTVYSFLTDDQAVDFLNIMEKNLDEYDYNFEYCNQDIVIKNIIFNNSKRKDTVKDAYNSYLSSVSNSKQNNELETMLSEEKKNNVISFEKRNK